MTKIFLRKDSMKSNSKTKQKKLEKKEKNLAKIQQCDE